ncbi:uncharacterized protein LOC124653132 [Lolium rigidum]|uniref:uncharacterized protein LOC124653132 n=1 Tax=Lolium rigidum TaxID=89674 RepID=UPI001F5DFB1A|nr:uncharacterized protein LOC124653132 [Lolium rigidum]
MDSGNSASLQSSSGVGEDELDSRCGGSVDSSPLSALLRLSASPSLSSSGFGATFYGLQELEASTPLPPLPQVVHQHHWTAALSASDRASASSSSSHGLPVSADTATAAPTKPVLPTTPRGSRKRARASRRTPTTVLTTDTSNFRAMVQEFTGIPSPPFAGAPARSRFDQLLFSSPSSLRSSTAVANRAASFPPYLLRPFAQKQQRAPFPPFALPSTSSPAQSSIGTASPTACSRTTAMVSGDTYRYHLLAPDPPPVGRVRSFQSPIGLQLGGGAMQPMLDAANRGLVPSAPSSQRLEDPADFLGFTHGFLGSEGAHLPSNPHNRDHREDELSGLVVSGICTTTYSDIAGEAPPLLERNMGSTSGGVAAITTTARATGSMRTQGVDAGICTSD